MAKGWKGFRSERQVATNESMSRKQIAHRTEQTISMFASPMVPAAELQSYEAVLPGLAERVVVMIEKEQSLRHDTVRFQTRVQGWLTRVGQIFGFLLAAGILFIAGKLLLDGKDVSGFSALIGALATLIIPFVLGRKSQD